MGLRRARSTQEKAQRHDAIVATALGLFRHHEYDEVTMDVVAREAGVAKGTVYLYFPTKEALFLDVLADLVGHVLASLRDQLDAEPPWSPEAVAEALSALVCAEPALTRLLPLLHGVLEHNVGVQRAVAFKMRLLEGVAGCAEALGRHLPALAGAPARRFLLWFYAALVGLGGMAFPARSTIAAMEAREEIRLFHVDLARELPAVALALLRAVAEPVIDG